VSRSSGRNLGCSAALGKDVELVIANRDLGGRDLEQLAQRGRGIGRKTEQEALALGLSDTLFLALLGSLHSRGGDRLDAAVGRARGGSVADKAAGRTLAVDLTTGLGVGRSGIGDSALRASLVKDVQLATLAGDLSGGNAEELADRDVDIGRETKDKALASGVAKAGLQASVGGGSAGLSNGLDLGVGGGRGSDVALMATSIQRMSQDSSGHGGREDSDSGLHFEE
jgi:hypothetical protein